MIGNMKRVTTSRMIERRSGAIVWPATSHWPLRSSTAKLRTTDSSRAPSEESAPKSPTEPGATSSMLRVRPSRCCRKIREATPVAAAASTVISPHVSHARMSTRVTFTALAP